MSGTSALLSLSKREPHAWTADRQHIQIGSMTLPRKTLTPYKMRNRNEYYPLDSIVFLLDSDAAHMKPAQYLTEATKQNIIPVAMTQKAALMQFLQGEGSAPPDLDMAGLERWEREQQQQQPHATEGDNTQQADDRAGKRQRTGDDDGTAASAPFASSSSSSLPYPSLLRPESEWREVDILREEFVLSTHLSVLQVPKKNFSHLMQMYNTAAAADKSGKRDRDTRDSKSSSSSSRALAAPRAPAPSSSSSLSSRSSPNAGIPIIVVPSAVSSVINMYNVKSLLEHGVFESGEFIRVQRGGAPKESMITITKASVYDASKNVKFQVIDDVTRLKGEEDWQRVVAVFASGAAWQFADWPKSKWSSPAAIFESVCAFHLHFDDEALAKNITQWRTHRLPISKTKRHGDRSVVLDFWHILNEFIATRNATKKLNI